MNTVIHSAQGASAYTHSDYQLFQSIGITSLSQANTPLRISDEWSPVIDELLRLRNLPDNWDGEGSEAPDPALVDSAIHLAQDFRNSCFTPPDRVHVGVNATVFLEWHTPLGYGEIEVINPLKAECRWVRKDNNMVDRVSLQLR